MTPSIFWKIREKVRELVAGGHYRHVSMSLMPDRVSLRHVALLGAAQPAIDGLKAVEFKDGGDAITVDFAAAVATKEATDEDSNMLRGKTACENAVAIRKAHMFANDWRIRKPAGAGNGYRLRDRRMGVARIAPP